VQSLRSWSSLSYKRYGTTLKPANAYKREKICPMTSARARAWRNVGLFRQRNKHYSLHKKICTRCAYGACQGEHLSLYFYAPFSFSKNTSTQYARYHYSRENWVPYLKITWKRLIPTREINFLTLNPLLTKLICERSNSTVPTVALFAVC